MRQRFFSFLALVLLILIPSSTIAATYNPNFILSDNELNDADAMSAERIQRFLEEKGSGLATYKTTDPNGGQKTAAQIIYDAGKNNRVSQRVLLATLQKEQSLLTTGSPSEDQLRWAMGYGVCDSCSKSDPKIQGYAGFYNQLHSAAKQFRRYYDEPQRYRYQPGSTYNIDGVLVTPVNLATSGQYNFTPHIHGTKLFFSIMQRYFAKNFLNGTLLISEDDGTYYVIQEGKKSRIANDTVLRLNFDPRLAIPADANSLSAYDDGNPIVVPDGTLVKAKEWGTVYIVLKGQRRGFANRDVFREIGYNPEEILDMSREDILSIPESTPIRGLGDLPQDRLLQSRETGGIIYVDEAGQARPLLDRVIYQTRFKDRRPVLVSQAEIDSLPRGEPLKIPDGYLVTSSEQRGPVYVISDGAKYRFPDAATFTGLGYRFETIKFIPNRILDLHADGGTVSAE